MSRVTRFAPRFITHAPAQLDDGVLYVSIEYATALHLCACGCRREVVTPFGPDKWSMTFDGQSVSLYPSIGNGSLPCRSHYWIHREGRVMWVRDRLPIEPVGDSEGRSLRPDEARLGDRLRGYVMRWLRLVSRR